MTKINTALIGYGYWGKLLYKYLEQSEGFNLSYVYFPSLKKYDRESISSKYGSEFTSDINEIWNDESVQNVIIATPIDTHYEVVKMALTNNKNVLVEKPLTENSSDAKELADLAQVKGRLLETEYTYTYSAALHYAKKMINKGAIGRIQCISLCFKQLGRFLPYDVYSLLGSHALSILNLFIPLSKISFSPFPLISTNNVVTGALIHFHSEANHCTGHIEVQLHSPQREKIISIYGEEGTIVYDPCSKDVLTTTFYNRAKNAGGIGKDIRNRHEVLHFDEAHNLRNALDNFYSVVTGNKKSNINSAVEISSILGSLRG